MTNYELFRNSSLDLSILGLCHGSSGTEAGFLPKNTNVLAWLNDLPIHFCLLPEHGDTVFVADPNALPDEQLLPVAEDIPSFIGLLVCCKDAALIAGAYQWSSFRFQELVQAVNPGMKGQSVIRALNNIYHPPTISNPGAMMEQLRKAHSASRHPSVWKVGFETEFTQTASRSQCGKELRLNRSHNHPQGTWHVPSVFLCEDGIVVDTVLETSPEQIKKFHEDWDHRTEETLSLTEKLQHRLDDPLTAAVTGILTVNDKPIRSKSSYTAVWNPMCDNAADIRQILTHYRLNPDCGYLFTRYNFPRKGKHPSIRTMQLVLEATPVMVPDAIFTVQKAGTRFHFTHPGTGLEHKFTAISLTHEALNPNFLTNHPCHYTRLTYTLEPSISSENFQVFDTATGDLWDGHQDDPAAVIYADRKRDPGRYALSSLHYEPCSHVSWQMIFRRKIHPDIQLKLLP